MIGLTNYAVWHKDKTYNNIIGLNSVDIGENSDILERKFIPYQIELLVIDEDDCKLKVIKDLGINFLFIKKNKKEVKEK